MILQLGALIAIYILNVLLYYFILEALCGDPSGSFNILFLYPRFQGYRTRFDPYNLLFVLAFFQIDIFSDFCLVARTSHKLNVQIQSGGCSQSPIDIKI